MDDRKVRDVSAPAAAGGPRYVAAEDLRRFAEAAFRRVGLTRRHAEIVADNMIKANLRGVDSHGVWRVPFYTKRIRLGLVTLRPKIRVEKVAPAAALVDGDGGMGAVIGCVAMDKAIGLARRSGIGVAGVRHSTHFGIAGYYVLRAIAAGMVGFTYTNSSPALPPWGGRKQFFGTSPLAIGVPGGRRGPYVLDMAMSPLARGKFLQAGERGETIPPGLILDAEGRPTTDASQLLKGGSILPFGGVKGGALDMFMDIIGGVMTGSAFAGRVGNPYTNFERPQDVGHVFIAMRLGLFLPEDEVRRRMDELIERMKAVPRADGVDEILVPGEPETRTEARRFRTGVPLPFNVWNLLVEESRLLKLPLPPDSDHPLDGSA